MGVFSSVFLNTCACEQQELVKEDKETEEEDMQKRVKLKEVKWARNNVVPMPCLADPPPPRLLFSLNVQRQYAQIIFRIVDHFSYE